MSLFEVVSAYSTTAMSIALPSIQRDLSISSYTVTLLALTIYSGPFVFGSLLAAPLSEVFGRVRILQISNLFFIGLVVGCGAATSAAQLIVFRALLGLVGSVPPVVAPGVIGETFRPESRERAQAVGLYVAIQLVGSLMGPIFGGITVQYASWRWIIYSTAVFSAAAQLLAMFFVDETCGPILARRRRKRLREPGRGRKDDAEHSVPYHRAAGAETAAETPLLPDYPAHQRRCGLLKRGIVRLDIFVSPPVDQHLPADARHCVAALPRLPSGIRPGIRTRPAPQ